MPKSNQAMNLQSIIDPIGKIVEDSFESVLVPISEMFNWGVIVLGLVGLGIWLKMQGDYNKKAQREGTLM